MIFSKKKDKDLEGKKPKTSPTDVACLATYARTCAVQENEILGHHYWEMHKQKDNGLWQINRIEMTEEPDENNSGNMEVFRTIKPQYYNLNFFDAVKQMADFENYLTTPTAEYINETIKELGDKHYIHVAESEGFIAFDAKAKRPIYVQDGNIIDGGKFRESDIQRAFSRAAEAKEKNPELFKKPEVSSPASSANQNKPAPISPMQVSQGVHALSGMTDMNFNKETNADLFQHIDKMDGMVAELKKYKKYLNSVINDPERTNYTGNPFWERSYLSWAEGSLQKSKSYIKGMKLEPEKKEELVEFFDKVELQTKIVVVQSWNKACEYSPSFLLKHKGHLQSALKKAVKCAKKHGVENITEDTLRFTLGQEKPKIPTLVSTFIDDYESWKYKQLQEIQKTKPTRSYGAG